MLHGSPLFVNHCPEPVCGIFALLEHRLTQRQTERSAGNRHALCCLGCNVNNRAAIAALRDLFVSSRGPRYAPPTRMESAMFSTPFHNKWAAGAVSGRANKDATQPIVNATVREMPS